MSTFGSPNKTEFVDSKGFGEASQVGNDKRV